MKCFAKKLVFCASIGHFLEKGMKFFVWVNIRNFIFFGVYKKNHLSFPINFKVF